MLVELAELAIVVVGGAMGELAVVSAAVAIAARSLMQPDVSHRALGPDPLPILPRRRLLRVASASPGSYRIARSASLSSLRKDGGKMEEGLRITLRKHLLDAFVEPERVLDAQEVTDADLTKSELNRASYRKRLPGVFSRMTIALGGQGPECSEAQSNAIADLFKATAMVVGARGLRREETIQVLATIIARYIQG